MNRGGGPRPEGSDGSDFSYRMTVEDRYKKAAKGKLLLRKFLNAQTGFQLLKALMLMAAAVTGNRPVKNLEVAGCVFGVTAVVVGTLGLKQGAARLLKVYIFFMGLAVGLNLVPLVTGVFYEKMLNLIEHKSSRDYVKLALLGLEGVQDVLGTVVNLMGLSIAAALIGHMSPPKKREL
ncbi:hypothetical protein R1flu_006067 [Riccia fluitans]|uniref:Uncharacterized protein n=1 Tax=Riccia fluitans TaxID=41844 RepID=A0ABD1YV76_9MARC